MVRPSFLSRVGMLKRLDMLHEKDLCQETYEFLVPI